MYWIYSCMCVLLDMCWTIKEKGVVQIQLLT